MSTKQFINDDDVNGFIEECNRKYYTEKEIFYRIPPKWHGKKSEIFSMISKWREYRRVPIALCNQAGLQLWYCNTPKLEELIFEIDRIIKEEFENKIDGTKLEEIKQKFLEEESFYSSLIEGSKTTRKQAELMISKKIKPRNISQHMTLNNYEAINFILKYQRIDMSKELILKLHNIVTRNTVATNEHGIYRNNKVFIGEYNPPSFDKVPIFMDELVEWANISNIGDEMPISYKMNPIIKAAIIHFYFVYIHPFFDGNGRVARALFYFYLSKFFSFTPYMSISVILAKEKKRYGESIRKVEEHGTDLTFFILYLAELTLKALLNLKNEIGRNLKAKKIFDILNKNRFNFQQRHKRFVKYLLKKELYEFDLTFYKQHQKVVYETARKDLILFEKLGLVSQEKLGKKFVFTLLIK